MTFTVIYLYSITIMPQKVYSNINIRATSQKQFWGTEFKDSIYLLEGAKHCLTYEAMQNDTVPVFQFPFSKIQFLRESEPYCRNLYWKLLPEFRDIFNSLNNVALPDVFWKTVFGVNFLRFIGLAYEKYKILSYIDIDATDIRLLDRDSFYIPENNYDLTHCYASDHGVLQLVTLYYELFGVKKFPKLKSNYSTPKTEEKPENKPFKKRKIDYTSIAWRVMRKFIGTIRRPTIVFCNAWLHQDFKNQLLLKSYGKIQELTVVPSESSNHPTNWKIRNKFIMAAQSKEGFEKFLFHALYFAVPKNLIENFSDHYNFAKVRLEEFTKTKRHRVTHIISEAWITDLSTSIHVALLRLTGAKLVHPQHGALIELFYHCDQGIEVDVPDIFISTGWTDHARKVIPGGFACRKPQTYIQNLSKKQILFVGTCAFHYIYKLNGAGYDAREGEWPYLGSILKLFNALPKRLESVFVYRPRIPLGMLDFSKTLDLKERGFLMANLDEPFDKQAQASRIVIVDSFGTYFAEILYSNIPLIFLLPPASPLFDPNYADIFNEFELAEVAFNSCEGLMKQLDKIYDDPYSWWFSDKVQTARQNFLNAHLRHPNETAKCILKLTKNLSK